VPSPVFHSFAGLALARLLPGPVSARHRLWLLGALVVAGNAPDLDFVPGILIGDPRYYHRGVSHTLIAVAGFTLAAVLLARWVKQRSPVQLGLVLGLAFLGHLLTDIFASWVDARSGVAIAWPLSDVRLISPVPLFIGISLAPGASNFFTGVMHWRNFEAMAWELLLAGAIWGAVRLIRPTRDRKSTSVP
jgi:inner membrane protein